MSTSSTYLLPELINNFTIWGGSGYILKTLHYNGAIPYWTCTCLTSILVRITLIPLVIQGAFTSSKFASVAPEIQFLLTLYQNDRKLMNERNEIPEIRRKHFLATLRNVKEVYRVHDIHPLSVLKAPLIQIPIFWYFAADVRRIIEGSDISLAKELSTGGTLWFMDLTEPDPYFIFPILTGGIMYLSVELAIGKQSLAGETTSKANFAEGLKDFFQSLSIFIPCFMSNQPAGVQIYLTSSFLFALLQGAVLRNDKCRHYIGLPSLHSSKKKLIHEEEPKIVQKFRQYKEREKQAEKERIEKRGGREIGIGVLEKGFKTALLGKNKQSSTIIIDNDNNFNKKNDDGKNDNDGTTTTATTAAAAAAAAAMPYIPEACMEAANRGDKHFKFYKTPIIMTTTKTETTTKTASTTREKDNVHHDGGGEEQQQEEANDINKIIDTKKMIERKKKKMMMKKKNTTTTTTTTKKR